MSRERELVSMRAKICEPVSTDLEISSNEDHGEHTILKEMVSNSTKIAIYHQIYIFSNESVRKSVDISYKRTKIENKEFRTVSHLLVFVGL